MTRATKAVIRPMTYGDIDDVVRVHLQSFPGFFLTFLGRDFLKLLYRSVCNDPNGIALVGCYDGQIDGFAVGVMHQGSFFRRLVKRQKWSFALATLSAVSRHPSIVPRLFRALHRHQEADAACAEAGLLSLAVRPQSQGQGIGRMLIAAFSDAMAQRGASAFSLTTDRDKNDRTNRFYRQLGFRLGRVYLTPEGRAINEYVLSVNRQSAGTDPAN